MQTNTSTLENLLRHFALVGAFSEHCDISRSSVHSSDRETTSTRPRTPGIKREKLRVVAGGDPGDNGDNPDIGTIKLHCETSPTDPLCAQLATTAR